MKSSTGKGEKLSYNY